MTAVLIDRKNNRNSLWANLEIQGRVIGALLMREILTRYGRHNIGFMWVFVEPMLFTCGVMLMRALIHHEGHAIAIVPFTVISYSAVLCWRGTIGRCGNAIEPNRSLMHHRNVRVPDLYVARILLELAGVTISFCTLLGALTFFDAIDPLRDPARMLAGWILLAWFASALALIIGGMSVVSDAVERVWHVISYLFLPLSGAFYMVDWLPYHYQWLATRIPTVDALELMREGYFGSLHTRAHYDVPYLIVVNLVLTYIGLLAVKAASRRLDGQ